MIDEYKLLEKWWWRALKAIYVLVWLATFSLIALTAYSSRPYTTQDNYYIGINCNSGQSYKHFLADSYYGDKPTFTNEEVDQLNRLCAYGKNASPDSPAITETNFKYDILYNNYGSWKAVAISIGVGFLVALILIEGIKSIVLYVLGVHVWRGMWVYVTLFLLGMFNNDNKKEGDK